MSWRINRKCQVYFRNNFQVLPKRWVVERTFALFETYRRLSKDFEFFPGIRENMIRLVMTKQTNNRY